MIINGYSVIQSQQVDPGGNGTRQTSVLLVDGGPDKQPHRYITAMHCENDTQWFSGRYFFTLEEATADYEARHRPFSGR